MKNLLESLREHTIVVADTGDFEAIQVYQPTDATTNPSLILKAVQQPKYQHLLQQAIEKDPSATQAVLVDTLLVYFAKQILEIVPGRVSTEVDARLSFDTQATIQRAHQLINIYKQQGIDTQRVLIKIAATWEGIQAAKVLEQEGIHCNITLLFALEQGIAAADAGVTLISPFVGRIYDWYKKQAAAQWAEEQHRGSNDPGVQFVSQIYHYYKTRNIKTEVMGASFRNIDQITALAGCDLLTISPDLLQELRDNDSKPLTLLSENMTKGADVYVTEESFYQQLEANSMAHEKLHEGINAFIKDANSLDELIESTRTKILDTQRG